MKISHSVRVLLLLGYVLGLHKGYLALWQEEDRQIVKTFPVRGEMLPAEDQRRLREGIIIHDTSDLTDLLEDYLS